jgi:hypothetical protein
MLKFKEIFPFLDKLPFYRVGASTIEFFVEGILHAILSSMAA